MATLSKRNFTRGIFSPVVQSRRDVDAWQAGSNRLTNVTLMKHGGIRKRMGTELVYVQQEGDKETRMLPFTFSTNQSYALLFGQGTMRPLTLGGVVLCHPFGITGITRANPGVVTAPFHAFTTGTEVFFTGISGMVELNDRVATVTVIDANNFSINIDTSGFGVFTGDDGVVRVAPPPAPPPAPVVPPLVVPPAPPPTTPPGGGGGGGGRNDPNIEVF